MERMAASKYDHDYGKNKKRFRLHDSKKLGCPAKLIINELMMFPSYKDAEAFLPVDKDVVKKIYEMVDEGVTDAQEMRRHIKNYLPSITSSLPSATNSRFNPSIRTIKNTCI
ncbi:hypothetical protein ACF0H5_001580 [Mactra antiquata]